MISGVVNQSSVCTAPCLAAVTERNICIGTPHLVQPARPEQTDVAISVATDLPCDAGQIRYTYYPPGNGRSVVGVARDG
jgi:hypothetical protein